MQQVEKKRTVKKLQTQPVKTHHISSFGILNRNGLEIPTGIEETPAEQEEDTKRSEFAEWSMPEQGSGFIQVRKHDFF